MRDKCGCTSGVCGCSQARNVLHQQSQAPVRVAEQQDGSFLIGTSGSGRADSEGCNESVP